jgi:hypothetical protein
MNSRGVLGDVGAKTPHDVGNSRLTETKLGRSHVEGEFANSDPNVW